MTATQLLRLKRKELRRIKIARGGALNVSRKDLKMSRLKPKIRRGKILEAAIAVAKRKGFGNLTRDDVAAHAGVSHGLVTHYYGTMPQLSRDVMRAAIKREIFEIIAYGLMTSDRHARKARPELRARAIKHMGGK